MDNLFIKSIFLGLFLSNLQNINCVNSPVITLKLGAIKGLVRTLEDGTSVNLFEGIRYGKAPVGPLRFRKPVAETKWDGVYDATEIRKSCPQTNGFNK